MVIDNMTLCHNDSIVKNTISNNARYCN